MDGGPQPMASCELVIEEAPEGRRPTDLTTPSNRSRGYMHFPDWLWSLWAFRVPPHHRDPPLIRRLEIASCSKHVGYFGSRLASVTAVIPPRLSRPMFFVCNMTGIRSGRSICRRSELARNRASSTTSTQLRGKTKGFPSGGGTDHIVHQRKLAVDLHFMHRPCHRNGTLGSQWTMGTEHVRCQLAGNRHSYNIHPSSLPPPLLRA
ncbi:hypothetical protein B0H67DRAFT_69615 [Lasiosphaeris hirsuta]|uniref:Uncharacterized protein n=1 Tax=Lasiosphaeris hirsuta TaxID=260670 RepID=A0AA40EBK0_9PEZI|nr:hypothetical protein B0H67DRAFT_69615 [Lasiosphaeris hirsuta]